MEFFSDNKPESYELEGGQFSLIPPLIYKAVKYNFDILWTRKRTIEATYNDRRRKDAFFEN